MNLFAAWQGQHDTLPIHTRLVGGTTMSDEYGAYLTPQVTGNNQEQHIKIDEKTLTGCNTRGVIQQKQQYSIYTPEGPVHILGREHSGVTDKQRMGRRQLLQTPYHGICSLQRQ
jgi:hypothetical protein